MKQITEVYSEATYRSRVFAERWVVAHFPGWPWERLQARIDLAKAKARLELCLAAYKVEMRKEQTR